MRLCKIKQKTVSSSKEGRPPDSRDSVFGHCNRSFSRLRSACATCDQVRVKTRQVLLYLDRIWRLYDERMVSRPDCAGGRELGAADANDLGNSYQGLG